MSDQPEMKELLFASTKESRLFGEFCDACRKYRYIGLCHLEINHMQTVAKDVVETARENLVLGQA